MARSLFQWTCYALVAFGLVFSLLVAWGCGDNLPPLPPDGGHSDASAPDAGCPHPDEPWPECPSQH